MRTPLLLAAAAALLRASMLRSRFPYIDDLLQLYAITRPTLAEGARAMGGIGPLQPPLDYLAGFLAARLGAGLTALRLLPVLWGAGAVALAGLLGARRRGPAMGAWWGVLLAVSMPLVSFSVTLRPYSLAAFLGLLCWWAFEDLLEGKGVRLYAACQTLFQIAYPHAWLVGLAQLAFVARFRRPVLKTAVLALVPSWLALGAWLAWWHWRVSSAGGFHYEVPAGAAWMIARSFSQAQGPGLWLYPALALWGAASALRREADAEFAALASWTLLACSAAIFAVHRLERVLILPRHLLPLLPAYLGLVASGCAAAQERAAARSPRARAWTIAALACAVCWAAVGPLSALAGREAALSAYLDEFTADLVRRTAPGDALIFADPNTGATVLRRLDPKAFDALDGVVMREGFALFRFPRALSAGRLEAYTLCFVDPTLATIDAARLRALRAARPASRRWLVSAEGLNALPQERPFAALTLSEDETVEERPGLYRIR